MTKVMSNLVQLWLQSTFFVEAFHKLSDQGKARMVAGIGVSALAALAKLLPAVREVAVIFRSTGCRSMCGCPCCIIFGVALCIMAWTFARLYFAFTCEGEAWSFKSGCVKGV